MDTAAPDWLVALFFVIVLLALFVDFVLLHKRGAHAVTAKEALRWSLAWVGLSLAFNALWWWAVRDATGNVVEANSRAIEFLTGYLIEKSLAIDNIFVFLMIFSYFSVPATYQKRVLIIGVIGAIVLRTLMILIGSWLVAEFHWVLYLFGAFLMVTGVQMWRAAGRKPALEKNPVLKLLLRIMPVSDRFDGERFFTVQNGRRIATPLLMVVVMVGFIDVIFAIDSIPAILAITTDPFIVLSSNIFAVLGLRAIFFLLAAVAAKFHLLSYGVAVILLFIGGKMMLTDAVNIPVLVSFGFVVAVLAITMVWSMRTAPRSGGRDPRGSRPG
jgi:tellurite resistance protein TerC